MAKYGIFGGLTGPWKKESIGKFMPFYVPMTVSEDETTHETIVTTDIAPDDIMAAYKKHQEIIFVVAVNENTTFIMLCNNVYLDTNRFVFSASKVVDMGSGDTHVPTMFNAAIDNLGNITVNNIELALAE